jgi:hypothetical protein
LEEGRWGGTVSMRATEVRISPTSAIVLGST